MFTLVLGGSKSGKSGFAEGLMEKISGRKFYVATMMPFGSEAEKAIQRHRKMREGKGFETIEKYTSVGEIASKYDVSDSAVLLECMGNLCANEMFSKHDEMAEQNVCDDNTDCGDIDGKNTNTGITNNIEIDDKGITDKIVKDIELLASHAKELVIVSNIVGEDGLEYSKETLKYIKNLGEIHTKLVAIADNVVEMVYGIPVIVKESENFARMVQKEDLMKG